MGKHEPGQSVRIVINTETSWSGHHALVHWLSEQAIEVDECFVSGSHEASLDCLRQGAADLAAIDACSFQFLNQRDVAILDRTPPAPAPHFVQHELAPVDACLVGDILGRVISRQDEGVFAGFIAD